MKRRNLLIGGIADDWSSNRQRQMMHIAMIGDSVFDNASYVGGAPDVQAQLKSLLTAAEVSSFARDGAIMADIPMQLRQIPRSTSISWSASAATMQSAHLD